MTSISVLSTHILRHKRVLVFLIVGFMNTLIGYSLFSLFLYSGLHYTTASFIATCISITINYHTIGKIVFNHQGSNVFLRFIGGCSLNYLLNISLIKFGSLFYSNLYVAAALALIPNACFSYIFNKYVIFAKDANNE